MDVFKVFGLHDGSVVALLAAGPEHAWHQYARRYGADITAVASYVVVHVAVALPLHVVTGEQRRRSLTAWVAHHNLEAHAEGRLPPFAMGPIH